jgi:hypothetical protein
MFVFSPVTLAAARIMIEQARQNVLSNTTNRMDGN